MANLLWGKVFYNQHFAGFLRQEPGERCAFNYDADYIKGQYPALSHLLPVQKAAYICENGLHPFFDNLVAEGWLEQAQARILGKREISRFELLLAFGFDCAGAVSVIDPEPQKLSAHLLDPLEQKEFAVLASRASLSGVQPKLAVIKRENKFYPAKLHELSTHIAKFPSASHADLIHNEYLTTLAFKALLPNEACANLSIATIEGVKEPALLIERFDRVAGERLHFEEFNQLLGQKSARKYVGSYKELSAFIRNTPSCLPAENYRLFTRILAGLLLGNTDMHLKNFALMHTPNGLRLTPNYDFVASNLYNYKSLALEFAGVKDLILGQVKPKHISLFAQEFAISTESLALTIKNLGKNKQAAQVAIMASPHGSQVLKEALVKNLEARWNALFA